jgi:lysophospholipase L1-like esterase
MIRCLALLILSATLMAAEPLRLVCIGDSITQGRAGAGGRVPTFSWRYPLWEACVDAGAAVDFVGSMTGGFEGSPEYAPHGGKTFVNHHEGRWGWTTRGVADALVEASTGWTADIAVVFLGTNDKIKEQGVEPTLQAMGDIVTVLRGRNATVKIAIGLPFQEWAPFPMLCTAYGALATKLTTPTSPVITVATSDGWVSDPAQPTTCTVDWVHPNTKGDAHVAARVFAAISPWITNP